MACKMSAVQIRYAPSSEDLGFTRLSSTLPTELMPLVKSGCFGSEPILNQNAIAKQPSLLNLHTR